MRESSANAYADGGSIAWAQTDIDERSSQGDPVNVQEGTHEARHHTVDLASLVGRHRAGQVR